MVPRRRSKPFRRSQRARTAGTANPGDRNRHRGQRNRSYRRSWRASCAKFHFESGGKVEGRKARPTRRRCRAGRPAQSEGSLNNAQTELERRKDLRQGLFAEGGPRYCPGAARRLRPIERVKAEIAEKIDHAPWDGRLGMRKIEVGKYVAAGTRSSGCRALIRSTSISPSRSRITRGSSPAFP